jgi:23S rRNA pseudouridine1911/1915/1917 synthase
MSAFADLLDILYEDNHLIAVNKPPGWPAAHFDGTNETMDRVVKAYLKEKYSKPGNVFLGVVHRLDKPVSGVLLFTRTSKAAARLSEQFRDGAVEKVYWAVVEGEWKDNGSMDDYLLHDDDERRVRVVSADTPGAKAARLLFQVKTRHAGLTLLELRPHTGRKHQLRVQLASRSSPIYGDRKYGSAQSLGDAIGLHARSLTVFHPITAEPLTLTAKVPKAWRGRFARLLT